MGISILWMFYQGTPPLLLVVHRTMKIRHEVPSHWYRYTSMPSCGCPSFGAIELRQAVLLHLQPDLLCACPLCITHDPFYCTAC